MCYRLTMIDNKNLARTHPYCHNGLGLLMEDCLEGRWHPGQRQVLLQGDFFLKQGKCWFLPHTEVVCPSQPSWC